VLENLNRLGQRNKAERPSTCPTGNTVNKAASSFGSDLEPSRFAAAPNTPIRGGFPGIPACSSVLRTGTVRGPGSLRQPLNMNRTL
jgi:hypothetical protein